MPLQWHIHGLKEEYFLPSEREMEHYDSIRPRQSRRRKETEGGYLGLVLPREQPNRGLDGSWL